MIADVALREHDRAHPPTSAAIDGAAMLENTSHLSQESRSRRHSEVMELRGPEMANIRRWDGAARACTPWDSLGKDPELWTRNGNCYVHLYAKGQSRRGPAFRLSLRELLDARCHPLVRFIARDQAVLCRASPGQTYIEVLEKMGPSAKVELYIPPPPMANKEESRRYHIATRNFFAWVLRRSMVGEHLGSTLINLLTSMGEFRFPGANNMNDLLGYLDEEGYLEMRNQPIHALGILHFAEHLQLRGLYINAFTHCVGMCDHLFAIHEYQMISSASRKLIRQAKTQMEAKLARAGSMLRNFLDEDLSEAHVGLALGGRAHLERFRGFLHGFYTSKLGFYPPTSINPRSTIFEREVYCRMRDDFEALYNYLVDESFTMTEKVPALAQGGICALQSVHGFDMRNHCSSLRHPLPLLPQIGSPPLSRRLSWLGARVDKLRPDNRLVIHASLVKATNKRSQQVVRNPLVVAYKKFEEDSVFTPHKADRHEKVSQVDARKIRWILIYAMYQVLQKCTAAPEECLDTNVPYNIAVDTTNLPPWDEAQSPVVIMADLAQPSWEIPMSLLPTMPPALEIPTFSFDIQPDIDYLALARSEASLSRPGTSPNIPPRTNSLKAQATTRPRGQSLSRGLRPRSDSVNGSFRRSMQVFTSSASSIVAGPTTPKKNRPMSYHEILVHGYGNGTNTVHLDPVPPIPDLPNFLDLPFPTCSPTKQPSSEQLRPEPLTVRTLSTASTSSTSSTANSSSSRLSDALSASSTAYTVPSPISQRCASTITIGSQDSSFSRSNSKNSLPPSLPRKNSRRKRLSDLYPIPLRPWGSSKNDKNDAVSEACVLSTATEVEDEDQDDGLMMRLPGSRDEHGPEVDVWAQFANIGGLTEAGASEVPSHVIELAPIVKTDL